MKKLIYRILSLFFWLFMMSSTGWAQDCNKPKNLNITLHNKTWYDAQLNWSVPDPDAQLITSSEILQVYDNGPFITGRGIGCQGYDVTSSDVSGQWMGWSTDFRYKYAVFDDFTLPVKTDLKYIETYIFSAGGGGMITKDNACINGGYVAIYKEDRSIYRDAQPIWGSVLEGDTNTQGLLTKVEFSNVYVTGPSMYEDCRYPLFKVTLSLDTVLPAGKYWIAFTLYGCPGAATRAALVRNPEGNHGNAFLVNYSGTVTPFKGMYNDETYDVPFALYGAYKENTVKGYEILRNGESIYKKNSPGTSYYDQLPDSVKNYTYEVKALWLKDSCESQPITETITMTQNPCSSPVPFYEVSQDFESADFPGVTSCWSLKVVGTSPLMHMQYKVPDEANNGKPVGDKALVYASRSSGYLSKDTGYVFSPEFTSEGKKMVVSFWMYRDNTWIGNPDLLRVYCQPVGKEIDSTVVPNMIVHRGTTQDPKVAIALSGWYHHSFAVDGTDWGDTAYQLTFVFTPAIISGGADMYIDDVVITAAEQPDGDCQTPTTPQVKYTDNMAELIWGAPGAFEYGKGEFGYANTISPSNALGYRGSDYTMIIASRWDSTDLRNLGIINGSELTAVSFVPSYVGNTVDNFVLNIWQGGKYTDPTKEYRMISPGKLIYEQPVDKKNLESREWNKVYLEMPVTIDPSKELWFGVRCDVYKDAKSGPFISDDGPYAYWKGNLMWGSDVEIWSTTMDWDNRYTYNWCLKAEVQVPNATFGIPSDPGASVKEYVIYRDGIKLSTVSDLSYTDNTIQVGKTDYEYAISAHYNTGCFSPKAIAGNPPTAIRGEEKGRTDIFDIYPNPANDVLNIVGKDIKKVEIYNHIGQLVGTKTVGCAQIHTASYRNGLYVLKITNVKDYTETKQIVIIH